MTAADPRPLAQRIADELRAEIESGAYEDDGRLPTTRELAARYATTGETIRQAIIRLKNTGLVTGRQGGGVFVRTRPPMKRLGIQRYDKARWRDGDEVAFVADRVASGRPYRRGDQTQTVRKVPAAPVVAAALGVPEGAEVYERARLIRDDDQPTHTLTSYYRPSHVEGTRLVDPAPGPAGPGGGFRVFHELGLEPHHMTEALHARMPTPAETERLQLPPGEPVMELSRTTRTADGTVIEYATGVHAASRFSWSYTFELPDSAAP
ncbi:putative HTH-type transcriptional regulator YurK [Streptomyces sp. RB5]|uniref:Putative HTH-type transcriptional regulator YurK n=1 Tax=Streptomyces smaragdinus TaxID=2585196 RepID=A0A7K0CRV5_9ACTN|nr:GntR family transcriptional regulator [Streptomyces smaragdinus]MQY16225.1 putative HTH-type transcriptional regulator YurK [Streptomyces smaragdinus]